MSTFAKLSPIPNLAEQGLAQNIINHLQADGADGLLPHNLPSSILSALDPALCLQDVVNAGLVQIVIIIMAAQRRTTQLEFAMDDLKRAVDTYALMLDIERERRRGLLGLAKLPTLDNVLDSRRAITFSDVPSHVIDA